MTEDQKTVEQENAEWRAFVDRLADLVNSLRYTGSIIVIGSYTDPLTGDLRTQSAQHRMEGSSYLAVTNHVLNAFDDGATNNTKHATTRLRKLFNKLFSLEPRKPDAPDAGVRH